MPSFIYQGKVCCKSAKMEHALCGQLIKDRTNNLLSGLPRVSRISDTTFGRSASVAENTRGRHDEQVNEEHDKGIHIW